MLLLFQLDVAILTSQEKEDAFAGCFDVTNATNEVYTALNYLFLRWTTEDKIDNTKYFYRTFSADMDNGECYGRVRFAIARLVQYNCWI